MSKTAQGQIDHVVEVRVSEGTKAMSRPAGGEVLTFAQEYDELIRQKQDIESRLSGYSKLSFRKEQMKIRSAGGDTLGNWLKKSTQMDAERRELIAKKVEIEKRMTFIAERARDERAERAAIGKTTKQISSDSSKPIFQAMLDELIKIRVILENNK